MKASKRFTKVTTFSKGLAAFLFIVLPFVGFGLGMSYQQLVDDVQASQSAVENNLLSGSPTPPAGCYYQFVSALMSHCPIGQECRPGQLKLVCPQGIPNVSPIESSPR